MAICFAHSLKNTILIKMSLKIFSLTKNAIFGKLMWKTNNIFSLLSAADSTAVSTVVTTTTTTTPFGV